MVEPVSLTVGAVVAALVTKAAEKGGENLADAAKTAVGRLVGWLRDRFSRDQDQPAVQALTSAERYYDSGAARAELAGVIDAKAAADAGFKAEVERLVAQAEQQGGVDVKTITLNAWGNQIAQIADVTGSTITTNIGGSRAPVRLHAERARIWVLRVGSGFGGIIRVRLCCSDYAAARGMTLLA